MPPHHVSPGAPVAVNSRQTVLKSRVEPRVSQACVLCRSRKVRCDGVHPRCSTCVSTLIECVWPTVPNRRGRRPAKKATSFPSPESRPTSEQSSVSEICVTGPLDEYNHSQTTETLQYFPETSEVNETQLRPLHGREISSVNSKPSWLCHGLVLPDRRGMVQLWEIFLRSTYVEIFGVFHKPTTTSQILRGQLSPELALGICMHAARFSTTEIAKHGTPLAAADFYGNAATKFLLSQSSMGTLDFIIAMLLLTLHEFSMKRGKEAWVHLGVAIRAVLSLDLGKEVAEDRLTVSPLYAPWKLRECRRRCFWSAFIIERIIASGSHVQNVLSGSPGLPRHHLLDLKDVNIQLPSTENDFMFFRPVLTHDSAELGSRRFIDPLPPGDNTANFGHMVKVCKVWGEISRWAFAPAESVQKLAVETSHAHQTLTQWDAELPERSKWNFENYSAHSVPGEALGCSFIFMHLVGRISFVLLGLKTFDYASEELLAYTSEDISESIPRSVSQRNSIRFLQTAVDSAKFILDISNDPMNLLGTSFLDYALYLASLLMMKNALLHDGTPNILNLQKLSTESFLYQVLSVYKRRIHYWKLTRAYSRVLRVAYAEFLNARRQAFRSYRFQTSIEYGSIENMEARDAESGNEAEEISTLMSQFVLESNGNVGTVASTLNNLSTVPDPSLGLELLDIDSLLAAQDAANAIQVSLSTTNDRWWNDLFGEDPMNMDHDLLLQDYVETGMSRMF